MISLIEPLLSAVAAATDEPEDQKSRRGRRRGRHDAFTADDGTITVAGAKAPVAAALDLYRTKVLTLGTTEIMSPLLVTVPTATLVNGDPMFAFPGQVVARLYADRFEAATPLGKLIQRRDFSEPRQKLHTLLSGEELELPPSGRKARSLRFDGGKMMPSVSHGEDWIKLAWETGRVSQGRFTAELRSVTIGPEAGVIEVVWTKWMFSLDRSVTVRWGE